MFTGTTEKTNRQERGFLCNVLGLLKIVGLLFMKNVLKPLAKTATASRADAGIHKNIPGVGTTMIISKNEMEDIIKIKKLKKLVYREQTACKTIENEATEESLEFFWHVIR